MNNERLESKVNYEEIIEDVKKTIPNLKNYVNENVKWKKFLELQRFVFNFYVLTFYLILFVTCEILVYFLIDIKSLKYLIFALFIFVKLLFIYIWTHNYLKFKINILNCYKNQKEIVLKYLFDYYFANVKFLGRFNETNDLNNFKHKKWNIISWKSRINDDFLMYKFMLNATVFNIGQIEWEENRVSAKIRKRTYFRFVKYNSDFKDFAIEIKKLNDSKQIYDNSLFKKFYSVKTNDSVLRSRFLNKEVEDFLISEANSKNSVFENFQLIKNEGLDFYCLLKYLSFETLLETSLFKILNIDKLNNFLIRASITEFAKLTFMISNLLIFKSLFN